MDQSWHSGDRWLATLYQVLNGRKLIISRHLHLSGREMLSSSPFSCSSRIRKCQHVTEPKGSRRPCRLHCRTATVRVYDDPKLTVQRSRDGRAGIPTERALNLSAALL